MGLCFRLVILLLLVPLPAFVLIIYNAAVENQRLAADVRVNSVRLVRVAAEGHKDLIDDAEFTLMLLSALPAKLLAPPGCGDLFKSFRAGNRNFANITVLNPTGDVVCSLARSPVAINFADRPWFQTALKTRRFTTSEVLTGRISTSQSIIFALPVLDGGGKVNAIVTISLRSERLDQLIDLAKLPAGTTFTVIDRNGTILRRRPDPGIWIGKRYPALDKLKSNLGKEGSYTEASGADGVEWFHAFTAVLDRAGNEVWRVAIGIPKEDLYTPVFQHFHRNLVWIILLATCVLTTAWLGCYRLVVRRIRRLVDVTATLANGDFRSRTGMANQRDEIGRLAGAVDQMAEALGAREEERQKAKRTRAQLAAIVESTSDAIIGRNLDGVVTSWNRGAETIYGYSKEEMIDQVAFVHVAAADVERVKRNLERARRGELVSSYEMVRIRKDGKPVRVSETLSPIIDDGGNIIGTASIARDISERKRAEEEIKALHEINLAITSSLDLDTILDNLLEQIEKIFPYAISHIRLVNEITGELEPVACRNIDEAIWKSEASAPRENSIHKIILDTKKPAVVRDIRTDERIAPQGFWAKRGITSYLGVPMILKDEAIGVLSLLTKEEYVFSETEVGFLVVVANQASIAIQNSQLYETTKIHNQALAANRNQIHNLMMAQLSVRDEEAKRIAAVLHDDSSQLLAAMRLALDDLENRPTAAVIERLQPIKDMLGQVEERLRNLSHELHPAILDQMGLQPSLDFLAEQAAQRTGIQVNVDVAINGRLSPALELCLYHVAQETLANVTRHAQAKNVEVQLCENEGLVHCLIQDDGIGFDPDAIISRQSTHDDSGLGLALVRERIEALGGTFELDSAPGKGSRIEITIPKEKNNVYPATAS